MFDWKELLLEAPVPEPRPVPTAREQQLQQEVDRMRAEMDQMRWEIEQLKQKR